MLDKKLPEEIIYKIISFLSDKDILNLCISKLFLPRLVNSHSFLQKLNNYFIHLLGQAYYNSNHIFLICSLHPVIINDTFHFSIEHKKLPYFKKLLTKQTFELYQLNNILKIWSVLFFQTLSEYKKHKTFYQKTIASFSSCNNLCHCHKYKMFPFYV